MGRFEKIFLTGGAQLFQYRYDVASNETERDNIYNGVNQFSPRDALSRMTSWDAKKGATVLAHEGYTYDAMNRITLVSYQTPQPADSFSYYLDGELKTGNLGNLGHNLTYNLDNKGNRTSVVDNNVTATYTPNTIDQYYPTAAGSSITNGLEHEIKTYGGVTFTYINDERLKSAASGSTTYSMVYDALGRCVKRSLSPGPTTYYIYDGEKPILEYDSGGTLAGSNVYGKGIDEILERVAIGAAYYPQQNHEGSVMLLTDTSGNVLERYRYDAFGAPTIYTSTWGTRSATIYDNRFLFTGREYAATYRGTTTPAFNFYEYRARAYNPKLGRFMSEDPKLFDAGDYNLFRYCHNDPEDFIDPMGLEDFHAVASTFGQHMTPELQGYVNARDAMAKWADSSNNSQDTFAHFAAGQGLSIGLERTGVSLAGTNTNLSIPKQTYDTGHAAAKAGVDPNYHFAEQDSKGREIILPVGQVDGFSSGHAFPGSAEFGTGKIPTGTNAGEQGSRIDHLTAHLPVGSHLIGYATVHRNFDAWRVRHVDVPKFEKYFGIPARILMKSPGYNENWSKPMYYSYPPQW